METNLLAVEAGLQMMVAMAMAVVAVMEAVAVAVIAVTKKAGMVAMAVIHATVSLTAAAAVGTQRSVKSWANNDSVYRHQSRRHRGCKLGCGNCSHQRQRTWDVANHRRQKARDK
jgi:hypothetical protein